MKRAGFTMIELIFVIVILGILSAVALPKFIGVSNQAKAGKCQAFIGTLNRTVLPTIWADMSMNGVTFNATTMESNITNQITVPSECNLTVGTGTGAIAITPGTTGYGDLVMSTKANAYAIAKPAGVSSSVYDVNLSVKMSADTAPILTWSKK